MLTIRSTALSKSLVGILTVLIAIVLPVNARADKITFPFTIDEKTKLPIFTLKVGDNTVTAMADTGNSARIVFGKDAAATLKLPDQGNAMGTGIGSAEAKKTTVPDGSIMGAVGEAKVAPVKGDGFYFKDLNPPFGAVVGAQFLRTDDKNGAFLLNSATGKATIYDKAQAEKLTALPLNAPTTAIASGSLVFPDTGTTLSVVADINNGATSLSSPFILSTGVSNTLISSVVAAELGISMSGPPENVTTELGTITVPTAHLSVNVFSQQDPVTLNIGILPDAINPGGVNVLGMDFFNTYPALIWNAATSTFSAAVVPELDTYVLMIAGLVIVGFMARRNNRHLFGNPKGGQT